MALKKKGHGARKKGMAPEKKGHGAAPCYFALDMRLDMYSHAHVYTCLHVLCLHSVDSPVSVALGFSALAAV